MSRTFFTFAVFYSVLAFIIYLIYSLFYFQLGRPIYTMQSFSSWFLLSTLVSLAVALIILRYYHAKGYKVALIAGSIAALASLSFSFVVYGMMMGAQLMAYYIPVYMISLVMGIIYSVSLIPAPAGSRPLLRAVGILSAIVNSFLLAVLIMFTQNALNTVEVERIHQWTSLAGMVIPALFTLNFVRERNNADRTAPDMPRLQQNVMSFVGVLAVVAFVIVGVKFTFESLGAIAWRSQEPERARRLAEPFEARTFSGSNGQTLLYRFMKPMDYDSTRKYPLVVCLHHGGTHGNDNMKQVDGAPIAQVLSTEGNKAKYPAFLFVPQCPEGAAWGGVETLPSIDAIVFEALAAFEREFSIDEKRRYVTGISGGGYGSWHFICSRPEMFAAGIPVCGGADPKLAPRIASIPVWAFHGEEDTAVPVRFSRDMISAMEAAGGDPKYTEFADAGHNIWEQVKATPGLLEWMFAQKKD